MKGKRYTEEQIISILKEREAGMKVADLVRKHGVGVAAYRLHTTRRKAIETKKNTESKNQ